jgi:hypothetical protein
MAKPTDPARFNPLRFPELLIARLTEHDKLVNGT